MQTGVEQEREVMCFCSSCVRQNVACCCVGTPACNTKFKQASAQLEMLMTCDRDGIESYANATLDRSHPMNAACENSVWQAAVASKIISHAKGSCRMRPLRRLYTSKADHTVTAGCVQIRACTSFGEHLTHDPEARVRPSSPAAVRALLKQL